MNTVKIALWMAVFGTLMAAAGCTETHAQQKQAIENRWGKTTAQANIPQAEELINRGQLEKAKQLLTRCLEADPELTPAYMLMGRIHLAEGQNAPARQAFEKAVRMDPNLDDGWYFLASLAVLEKDYAGAQEFCQKALDLQPANTEYILSLSDICLETGRLDRAQEILDGGLSAQSGNLDLILAKARLYQRSNNRAEALRLYEQVQLTHGAVPQILEPCGYAYMADGQWLQAAEKFDLLLPQYQADPDRYNATMRSLAMSLFNAGRYGQAMVYYDKLSVVFRQDADIWLTMAHAAMGIDDAKRAAYCADQALKYHPSWPKAYAVRGSAQYLLGQYEQALQDFTKITGEDELAGFAWFMTGRCYQQMGQAFQANAAFEKAQQMDPDNELISTFLKGTLDAL
ncbi:MAG: tetratricopeptide repeat protein [Planctomycetales bacterium]|nr:tetratricopeptide repeat protein [Planctomycetales bacterium]